MKGNDYMQENTYGGFSVLKNYGEDLTAKTYITDPSIARDEELKKLYISIKSDNILNCFIKQDIFFNKNY